MNNFNLFTSYDHTQLMFVLMCAILLVLTILHKRNYYKMETTRICERNLKKNEHFITEETREKYYELLEKTLDLYNQVIDQEKLVLILHLLSSLVAIGVTYTIKGHVIDIGIVGLGMLTLNLFEFWTETQKK